MASLQKKLAGRLVGRRITTALAGVREVTPGASQGMVVSVNTVQGAVQRHLTGKLSNDSIVRYGDGSYYLPTTQEVQQILTNSQLDRRTWMAERFDCDDFAYVLKGEMSVHAYDTGDLRFGLCVGMVWGRFDWINGYHAVNWFVDPNGVLRFIEPQTDVIYESTSCQGEISLLVV